LDLALRIGAAWRVFQQRDARRSVFVAAVSEKLRY